MLVLDVREANQPPRTMSFSRTVLGMGQSLPGLTLGGDIGLTASGVDTRHCELFERDGRLELRSHRHTLINGDPRRDPRKERPIEIGTVIGLGAVEIVVVAFRPIMPHDFEVREADFLRAMDTDRALVAERLVYADALEEGDWLIRAEYLRVQLRLLLGEAIEGDAGARDRYLKNLLPAWRWVQRVGEPLVADNCRIRLGRECPTAWGSSILRPAPSVCTKCNRAVRYPQRAAAPTPSPR